MQLFWQYKSIYILGNKFNLLYINFSTTFSQLNHAENKMKFFLPIYEDRKIDLFSLLMYCVKSKFEYLHSNNSRNKLDTSVFLFTVIQSYVLFAVI